MRDQQKTRRRSTRHIGFSILGFIFVVSTAGMISLAWSTRSEEVSLTYATWVLAFFTLVLAVGIPITIWVAGKESEESSRRFLAQERDRFYAQLDNVYLDIQKMIIEHPHLANPVGSRTPDEEIQYKAFAFIVWNFIESIYDYTSEDDRSDGGHEHGTLLSDTWHCIIKYEGTLHAKWFANPENQYKFKEKFREAMKREIENWARSEPTIVTVHNQLRSGTLTGSAQGSTRIN